MKHLVLIPSNTEHELFYRCIKSGWSQPVGLSIEVCGVGLVASAVGSASLLAKFQPDLVFLVGIAGLLNANELKPKQAGIPITSTNGESQAIVANSVLQHGVGVGEGGHYQSAETMGFRRFNRDIHLQTPDEIALRPFPMESQRDQSKAVGGFLSVASASSCFEEAERRRAAYPTAILEDMETYSVALACHSAGVPLIAIRGISNLAGDRDFGNWDSQAAMQAATDVLLDYLS